MVLSISDKTCLHIVSHVVEWMVEAVVIYHATSYSEFFTTYKVGDFGTVNMGNVSSLKIFGVGEMQNKTNIGCTMVLKDV